MASRKENNFEMFIFARRFEKQSDFKRKFNNSQNKK